MNHNDNKDNEKTIRQHNEYNKIKPQQHEKQTTTIQ